VVLPKLPDRRLPSDGHVVLRWQSARSPAPPVSGSRPLHDWQWLVNWRRWRVRGPKRSERWGGCYDADDLAGRSPVPLPTGWSRAPARVKPGGWVKCVQGRCGEVFSRPKGTWKRRSWHRGLPGPGGGGRREPGPGSGRSVVLAWARRGPAAGRAQADSEEAGAWAWGRRSR
jgi:hypothetical protein